MSRRLWTRDELILTLSVYFQLPFGKLNRTTPDGQALARLIGRSENSAALRLVIFADCDPYIIYSGRTGMSAGVPICKPIWDKYSNDRERLFVEAQSIKTSLLHQPIEETLSITESELEGKITGSTSFGDNPLGLMVSKFELNATEDDYMHQVIGITLACQDFMEKILNKKQRSAELGGIDV